MIQDLTPRDVADRLPAPGAAPRVDPRHGPLLLDVREHWEHAIAAIPGSTHIPMGEVPSRAHELPRDRDVVVVCHHGHRSRRVAVWLSGHGHPQVANLAGGIDAWSSTVDPAIPRYE